MTMFRVIVLQYRLDDESLYYATSCSLGINSVDPLNDPIGLVKYVMYTEHKYIQATYMIMSFNRGDVSWLWRGGWGDVPLESVWTFVDPNSICLLWFAWSNPITVLVFTVFEQSVKYNWWNHMWVNKLRSICAKWQALYSRRCTIIRMSKSSERSYCTLWQWAANNKWQVLHDECVLKAYRLPKVV